MLAPGQAVERAREYLEEVIPDFAALQPKVEEMALTPDSSQWRIVFFAYTGEIKEAASLAELLSRRRMEKIVALSAQDGSLIAVSNPQALPLAS